MSLKSKFGTVKNAETEGVWVTVEYNDDGTPVQFKLRRASNRNKDYVKSLRKGLKPFEKVHEVDPEIDAKIMRKVLFDSIVTDWKNVRNGDDTELAFNQTNFDALLLEYPDLQTTLNAMANDIATFQEKELEDEAKN